MAVLVPEAGLDELGLASALQPDTGLPRVCAIDCRRVGLQLVRNEIKRRATAGTQDCNLAVKNEVSPDVSESWPRPGCIVPGLRLPRDILPAGEPAIVPVVVGIPAPEVDRRSEIAFARSLLIRDHCALNVEQDLGIVPVVGAAIAAGIHIIDLVKNLVAGAAHPYAFSNNQGG